MPLALLFALLMSLISFAPGAALADRLVLNQAELLLSASETPPAEASGWQSVELPDTWPDKRYAQGDNGWYRFTLQQPPPQRLWGLYLPRLNMNAAVWFNGVLLGDGGSFDEPLGRNWSRPLYFTVPAALWREDGANIIHIRLKSYYGYGRLGQVIAGPDRLLGSDYRNQLFWQVGLAKALFLVLLAISLFMFGIWRKRRADTLYLWFALASLSWALLALNIFISNIPFPEKWWDALMYSNIAWWTVFIAFFSHRFAAISQPRLEAAYLLWAAASSASYLLGDLESFPRVTFFWQLGSPIIGFILITRLVKTWRKNREGAIAALALGITLIQLAGIYNYLTQSMMIPLRLQIISHVLELTSPVMLILIAWHLTNRFVRALNESEALNAELEARVAAKSRALEESYQKLAALEKQQAILAERERIHRDLHDDVGAKLLSLTYRATDEQNAELARSALQDLRDVVSRASRNDLSLSDALADWRAECHDRLDGAGITLDWRQADGLPQHTLQSQQTMNIGRILREAVSNIIRHAQAKNVSVSIRHDNNRIDIQIENDGRDCNSALLETGRGTQNMKVRATLLGGALNWEQRPNGGSLIRWWFPLTTTETAST